MKLRTPVRGISWSPEGVEVHSTIAQSFVADLALVTLPLGVLKADDVRFTPSLPPEKQSAIDGLGAGHVDKIVLRFRERVWPQEMAGILTTLSSQLWWRPGWGREDEVPVLTAIIGGDAAAHFESLGSQAIPQALDHLSVMLDVDMRRHFETGLFVAWGTDRWSRTGYSYEPINAAGLRAQLDQPVEGVLFFAGEATHATREVTSIGV